MRSRFLVSCLFLCGFSGLTSYSPAADWFRWRGPDLNGVSSETGWRTSWPDGEATIAWKAKVGTGFSSMVTSQGRVYTMGNEKDVESVVCLDAETGKVVWTHEYPCPLDPKYFEGGPTSTPTVDGEHVYSLSRRGHVFCLEAASGKVLWSKNVQEETGAAIPSWGFSGAPLVSGDLLVLNVGEAGLALEKKTGKIVWQSEVSEAGYSTPYPFKASGGRPGVLLGSAKAYVAVDMKSGDELWRHRWLTRYGVNAADPILQGTEVFIASGYNKGGVLLQLGEAKPKEGWKTKELRTQMNPAVLLDGYLYGTDGDSGNDAQLKCLDWKTGEVKWTQKGIGTGGVIAADGKLIVLTSRGELIIAPASPEGFEPISRSQVLGGKCWTVPVLSHGRIFCRNAAGDLVCIDARGEDGSE